MTHPHEGPHVRGYQVDKRVDSAPQREAWHVTDAVGRRGVLRLIPGGDSARLRALQALSHPGLAPILDVLTGDGQTYVVTQAVSGHTLAQTVARHGALDLVRVAALWRESADALAALHDAGIVHGQISPAILVFDDAGRVILTDNVPAADVAVRSFVAPEDSVSVHADIWAVARAIGWAAGEDPRVLRALGSALAPDPMMRPAARQFALNWHLLPAPHRTNAPADQDLDHAARSDCEPMPPVSQVRESLRDREPPRPRRVRWWLPAMLAAGAVSLGVWGIAELRPQQVGCGSPVSSLEQLLERRDAALAAGEPDLGIYVDNSAAQRADSVFFAKSAHVAVSGYQTTIRSAVIEEQGVSEATVQLEFTQGAFVSYGAQGELRTVAEQPARCVRVHLSCSEEWKVSELLPCPQQAAGRED